MTEDDESPVATALSGLVLAVLGLQVTLVGLLDGSSGTVLIVGLALGVAGAIRANGT